MQKETLSQAIDAIRPVALLGPVLIHARLHTAPTPAEHLFATVLGGCAVPFLFFVSGLLFFREGVWDATARAPQPHRRCATAGAPQPPPRAGRPFSQGAAIWLGKLRHRVRTLLVPYLAWNLLAYLLGAFVLGTIARGDFLRSFWAVRVAGRAGLAPADGPTYFLKTLLQLALAAPALHLVNRNAATAWWSPLLALLWCVSPFALRTGHDERAIVIGLVFFNLGAWAALRPRVRAWIARLPGRGIIPAVPFIVLAALQCRFPACLALHRATILASIPALVALGGVLAGVGLPLPGAASRAMFLFGAFDLLLPPLRTALVTLLGNGAAAYFALAGAAVAVSALCHGLLRRLCPAFLRLLVGGRGGSAGIPFSGP